MGYRYTIKLTYLQLFRTMTQYQHEIMELSFDNYCALLRSVKDEKPVDFETGEGIFWHRLSSEEVKELKKLNLDWKEE